MKNKFRSKLYQAQNLGSSGTGSHHWWHQRFTALFIVFMVWWVFYFFSKLCLNNFSEILYCLQTPLNAIMLVLFLSVSLYHGTLGIQVVIEDYIHCRALRFALLFIMKTAAIITIVAFIITILFVMRL